MSFRRTYEVTGNMHEAALTPDWSTLPGQKCNQTFAVDVRPVVKSAS